MSPNRVLLHADVELSAIDGSTSWLISLSRAFVGAGAQVDILARNVPSRPIVLNELRRHASVRVVYPNDRKHNGPDVVSAEIARMADHNDYTLVVIRGADTAEMCLAYAHVRRRLWVYLADFPDVSSVARGADITRWRRLVSDARGVFAQTSWLRSHVEAMIPRSVGKIEVLEPMVPDEFFDVVPRMSARDDVLQLGYAGKLDKPWHALEIPDLVAALGNVDVTARVTMYGDKIQAAPGDATWHLRMRERLEDPPPGVEFPGAIARSEVMHFMASCDIGIGWRSRELDHSMEVSTKLLEFSACGVPTVINRTAIHEELFGSDYPLFVPDDIAEVTRVIAAFAKSRHDQLELSRHVQVVARNFSVSQAAERLKALLAAENQSRGSTELSSAVYLRHPAAGSERLAQFLRNHANLDVSIVELDWQMSRNEARCRKLDLSTSDVVIVDWFGSSIDLVGSVDLGVPVVAWVDPVVQGPPDLGYANPTKIRGVDAIAACGNSASELARQIDWVPVRAFDVTVPSLPREVFPSGKQAVEVVLHHGDNEGLASLRELVGSCASVGLPRPLSIIVMDPRHDRGGSSDSAAKRFERDLHVIIHGLVEKVPMVVRHVAMYEAPWSDSAAAIVLLGRARGDEWIVRTALETGTVPVVVGESVSDTDGIMEVHGERDVLPRIYDAVTAGPWRAGIARSSSSHARAPGVASFSDWLTADVVTRT